MGAQRASPLDDVPVELLGPLAGQSVGDLFDVLVTTSGKALEGWYTAACQRRALSGWGSESAGLTMTTLASFGSVLAIWTVPQMACADSRAGIIPSSWVQRRNPRRASSSLATMYSARPESFNQACSGPTPCR